MKRDLAIKKGKFIGKVNSLSQEFHYVSPDIFIKILNIYAVSFPGSCLWDMFSADCDRLYKAWNVAVRMAWNVPNTTHRYLIESLSQSLHPKVMLASRYVNFVNSLNSSPKYVVRVLAASCSSDLRTVIGRTLHQLEVECNCERPGLNSMMIKRILKYFPVPGEEEWRLTILRELVDMQIPGFSLEEVQEIRDFICTS